ncbi:MAG: heavy metal translocating P-type ATPase [Christensenellales bacterium]|jgi:Cd2+/Zn2+-exporting ATPase
MNKTQKKNLLRIIITAILMVAIHFIHVDDNPRLALYLIPYLLIGYDILIKAAKGIKNGQPFDENLLMSIATIGAIVLARLHNGDYVEAIAVMLLYQIGEWFQSYAVGKSRKDVVELMNIAPDYANVEGDSGNLVQVDPHEVEVGTVIVVKPGERIPIDGLVLSGKSSLNTAALTGEPIPRDVVEGDEVISGCINLNGLLKIKTTKEFGESTVSKVLELIEEASSRKSNSEKFITKFARVYTPVVVISALALAILPPLVLTTMSKEAMWTEWIYRALTFLIISCPCALVISIPLSFFAGIGGASRNGVLVKGSNYMETLSEVKTFVFDKTGTLTKGVFEVVQVNPKGISQEKLLHFAANAEKYSTHPIAQSLRLAYPIESENCLVENVNEISGQGVSADIDGKKVHVGNSKMMKSIGVDFKKSNQSGTALYVALEGNYVGNIVISDVIKEHSTQGIRALKQAGANRVIMLTGDSKDVAEKVSHELGISEVYGELLPQDKVAKVEQFLAEEKKNNNKLAFVGDGINDAPVLSRADVGIAMGAMGSDAAIEAADVVLMDDDPLKIATALKISRKCLRIVKENIWFSIGVKLIVLILGAVGMANLWAAIFADVGVTVIAVLNAMRCMRVKKLA